MGCKQLCAHGRLRDDSDHHNTFSGFLIFPPRWDTLTNYNEELKIKTHKISSVIWTQRTYILQNSQLSLIKRVSTHWTSETTATPTTVCVREGVITLQVWISDSGHQDWSSHREPEHWGCCCCCWSLYPAGRLCWAQGTQSHGAGAERAADCHPEWTTEHQDSAEQNAHRELHSPKWLQNILRMDSSCVFFTPCKAILLHLFFKQRTQMVCSTHALKKGSFVCIVCFFLLTHLNEESVDTQAGSQSEQPVLSKQVGRWKPLKN